MCYRLLHMEYTNVLADEAHHISDDCYLHINEGKFLQYGLWTEMTQYNSTKYSKLNSGMK
jgi:hypothetical protein